MSELVVKAGDTKSFEAFFTQMRRPLLSVCTNLTGNEDDAKDAVEEAFIAMHRQLPSFRGESSFTTWAFQIAIRTALRTRAFSLRKKSVEALKNHAHPQLSPENAVAGRQLGRDVARALDQLTNEQRLVLSARKRLHAILESLKPSG